MRVIAFGAEATGVIAIGQVATGVIFVFGLLGRLRLRPHVQFQRARAGGGPAIVGRVVVGLALAALVWFVAIGPLVHELTRVGGVLRSPPHVLR